MRKDFRCRLWIDRVIAGETWKQVVVAGGVFALAFIIIGIIYLANRHTFGQAFVDMVSPVTAQKEAYDLKNVRVITKPDNIRDIRNFIY